MAQNTTIIPINPITFELQDYSTQDTSLISNFTVEPTFNPPNNYVTYFIYDLNNNVVFANDTNFEGYNIIDQEIYIDPENDLRTAGFDIGQYNVVYNFINNEASSSFFQRYYIDEISSDGTEIRLNTTQISNVDVILGANDLSNKILNNPGTYFDFYLNFGNNQLVIANNVLLDNSNPNDPTILIKLYEPLPLQFNLKDECWVVTQVAESVAYNIDITETFESIDEFTYLKGPNYNLAFKDQINNSTEYVNYGVLTSSSYATGSTNLEYQINSILAERGIEINVNYSDYSNFIYLSSAQTRLENFYYKLQLIEEYTYSASLSQVTNSYVTSSRNIWQAKINEIITTFDGYDYYLYYESGSTAWPKTNSTYPYTNVSTAAGLAWFTSQSAVAEEYDRNNNNSLVNAIPTFLRDDTANAEYELFVEMLGEMFDNIWIYYQDVANKWNADNRLQYGVSKDLVADVLRDLGVKIYESSFGSADLYTALLGLTPGGNQFPFPNITSSLPTPSGFEYVNTQISASNVAVPLNDIEKSFYKRLYHNLPLLLKKKGTTVGLQNLITSYGIPSDILRVAEFGGKNRDNSNDWDYWKTQFNYAYTQNGNNFISSSWGLNIAWGSTFPNVPSTVMFRFKTNGLPTSNIPYSQSLWHTNSGTSLILTYTGSGYATSSLISSSADPINPYYQYAKLDFIPDLLGNPSISASVYLPFFNGDWWSIMVNRSNINVFSSISDFGLYVKNSIYNGYDGNQIGFQASGSVINGNDTAWKTTGISYFGKEDSYLPLYKNFSGSFQEVRYYNTSISESVFDDFVMNPNSIEGNGINQGPNQLAFRASLGGELYTGSASIHPKVTGSWATVSSFTNNSNFNFNTTPTFIPNTQSIFLDQPPAGIKNIVSNKIQIVPTIVPTGSTLSQYISIQQSSPLSSSYTDNLAYTEVAFSPQNEINDDIMAQIGFFNMGEYIGDPRQRFNEETSYPNLDTLRNAYFEKYTGNYDINDYIRLIKFFDNSLFKMVQDFTPARSSLAAGVVIKQHLLERNKYPQPEVGQARYDYSGSIDTAFVLGGAGGTVNQYNSLDTNPYYVNNVYGVTQSYSESIVIPSGVVNQVHSSQDEFYNGEYSGSNFVVTNGNLNSANIFKQPNDTLLLYDVTLKNNTNQSFSQFFASGSNMTSGDLIIYFTVPTIPGDYTPGGSGGGFITPDVPS